MRDADRGRLADEGLRYSRFHVTSLCSPTRQALLTGRNHHSVGMGVTSEMSTPEPGYHGFRPASAATIAQILGGNGYSTSAFGKWHQTPPVEVSPSGPFTRWPTGEGFDHFYGFMGAEMNHWYPQLFEGTRPVEPDRLPEDGYHLSEDLVDHAIDWVSTQQAITPDRPFFTYLALGATHAPFHVAPAWSDKYAGRFDAGWDAQREKTLGPPEGARHRAGVGRPAPWAEGVPRWDELDETERRVAARFMEVYAGFAEHADVQIGRFVAALDELGVLDDTLFFYLLGDNGASGEGGPRGTFREHLVGHGLEDDTADMAARLDELGDATTYPIYPVGWALAMNTPYPWTKQVASHLGGVRDGMIVRWGNGIADRGGIRHQWHHVIDVLPTILDAVGVPEPDTVAGVEQQPIEGVSLRYTFDDADAPDRRTTQYFEMVGNRGIYHQGWTAVTRHGVPWEMVDVSDRPFEDDVWELYDLATDWTQAHDVAADHPDLLQELQAVFDWEGEKYHVFPLDARVTERENPDVAGRLDLHQGRTTLTFGPRVGRLTEEAAPNVKNRSHVITAVDRGRRQDQRGGGRAGRPVRRVVALPRRRRPGLRLQLRGPRPDGRAGQRAAGARTSTSWCCASRTTAGRRAAARRPASRSTARWRLRSGSRGRRPTTSPSTRASTSGSTAARPWSTTTRQCTTGSRVGSGRSGSISRRKACRVPSRTACART